MAKRKKIIKQLKVIEVLEVGTIPVTSDSLTLGRIILISLAFNKRLSGFEATPMILILYLLAYFNIFVNRNIVYISNRTIS